MDKIKNKIFESSNKSILIECLLTVFFLFFIFSSQLTSSLDTNFIGNTYLHQNVQKNPHKGEIKSSHNNLPLKAVPESTNHTSFDENEFDEDTNEIIDVFSHISAFENFKITIGINVYLYQLKQTLHNCNTIDLFVLHHSWKSYLS